MCLPVVLDCWCWPVLALSHLTSSLTSSPTYAAEENWAEQERYVLNVKAIDDDSEQRLGIDDVAAVLRPAMAQVLGAEADVDGAAAKLARQVLEVCGVRSALSSPI